MAVGLSGPQLTVSLMFSAYWADLGLGDQGRKKTRATVKKLLGETLVIRPRGYDFAHGRIQLSRQWGTHLLPWRAQ